jgi:hypothetical protein
MTTKLESICLGTIGCSVAFVVVLGAAVCVKFLLIELFA